MRSRLLVPCALLLVACVETPRLVGTGPTVLWEGAHESAPAPATAPLSLDEARTIADAHEAAHACVLTARALRQHDHARAWAVMEQCVLRPDFTDLESLVSAPWLEHLRAHPEATRLVAQVIAARGGDVQHDLRVVRRARIPLFSLTAAVADPESYRGRHVLVHGEPRDSRSIDGTRALEIAETRIMAESEWVALGSRTATLTATALRRGDGDEPTPLREEHRRSEGQRVEVLHNVSVETGRTLLVDASSDPFLEVGTDYVVLVRLDGVREAVEGSVVEERPVGTVLASFEPASGLFARLGR